MVRKLLCLVAFVCVCASAYAGPPRMAIGDFTVTSDNPKLKYVGKGFAEMIGAELALSKGVVLIDRAKRDQLLGELEFSLSGLSDSDSMLRAGELLAADYLLFGDLVDLGDAVLVSCKMVKTETGEVAWQDKYLGPLADYDGISKSLAASALRGLGATTAVAVVSRPSPQLTVVPPEKKEQALLAFSGAVEALDQNDTEAAKVQLAVARAIDPANAAVTAYLAKLVTNTTKFKIQLESYVSYLNPAFLGIIRQDSIHLVTGMPVWPVYYMPLVEGLNYTCYNDDRYVSETVSASQFGYSLPLGDAFGVRLSGHFAALDVRTRVGSPPISDGSGGQWSNNNSARGAIGGGLDAGVRLGDAFAIGAGFAYFARSDQDTSPIGPIVKNGGTTWAADLGFLVRNADESLVWDTRASYIAETQDLVDPLTLALTGETQPFPLGIENNVTFSLLGRKLFIILKNSESIALGDTMISSSLMPAAEYFLLPWLSLRCGVEGTMLVMDGLEPQFGLGGMGGLTLRLVKAGLDLDLNVSYRMRPSSAVPGYLYPDFLILLNANWNGVFKSQR